MGNKGSKNDKNDSLLIKKYESKWLITWNYDVTRHWLQFHIDILCRNDTNDNDSNKNKTNAIHSTLTELVNILCIDYGLDGIGLSLINENLFINDMIKPLLSQIDKQNTCQSECLNIISKLWENDINRVRLQFDKEYPKYTPELQDEPKSDYIKELISSKEIFKLIDLYHKQTEHGVNKASRSKSRHWILQPSTCKRFYGLCKFIQLNKYETIEQLSRKKFFPNEDVSLFLDNSNNYEVLSMETLSYMLWHSVSLSGTREGFSIWTMPYSICSKRCNASSGGLHPCETYLILPNSIINQSIKKTNEIANGKDKGKEKSKNKEKTEKAEKKENEKKEEVVDKHDGGKWKLCHYSVFYHGLEVIGTLHESEDSEKKKKNDTIVAEEKEKAKEKEKEKDKDDPNCFFILISSVDFREIWKYGERGLRYSLLDVGHMFGSLLVSLNIFNWNVSIVNDNQFINNLNKNCLPKGDYPRILLKIDCSNGSSGNNGSNVETRINETWITKSNIEMIKHATVEYPTCGSIWPICGFIQNSCLSQTDIDYVNSDEKKEKENDNDNENKSENDAIQQQQKLIKCDIFGNFQKSKYKFESHLVNHEYALRHRRSALTFEKKKLSMKSFMDCCYIMCKTNLAFKSICCFILYIIRVENIQPGLYLLFSNSNKNYEIMYEKDNKQFGKSANNIKLKNGIKLHCVANYHIETIGDLSKYMACSQDLCKDGAFTIDFCVDSSIWFKNGFNYSWAHFEAGLIGQLLYDNMEVGDAAACAIGCYLDDLAVLQVGFIEQDEQQDENQDGDQDGDQEEKEENDKNINGNKDTDTGKKENDNKKEKEKKENEKGVVNHPLRNVRSLCHFSCGIPCVDDRYPSYSYERPLLDFQTVDVN